MEKARRFITTKNIGQEPIIVRNQIQINAPSEKVWTWLVNAKKWPEWYVNSSRIQILDNQSDKLDKGTKFKWKTFGARFETEVVEYVPNERIAWKGIGVGIDVYHVWQIVPTNDGCYVITEETQDGWICSSSKSLIPLRINNFHEIWLKGLKEKAETN